MPENNRYEAGHPYLVHSIVGFPDPELGQGEVRADLSELPLCPGLVRSFHISIQPVESAAQWQPLSCLLLLRPSNVAFLRISNILVLWQHDEIGILLIVSGTYGKASVRCKRP